ncbi:MAG: histidine kinase [Chitinophagaceae bacterium]|nr:histidine kinase [Chitinophagaceae bacterium]
MINQINKQVFKIATITSPIIALLLSIPIYLLRENKDIKFFPMWFLVFMATLISWWFNSIIFKLEKPIRNKYWFRITLSLFCALLLSFSPINLKELMGLHLFINDKKTLILKLSTLCSINLIVFIIFDLVVSNETAMVLNKENAELKFSNLEAEYKLLKDQINPHFLFNALNTSKSLIKSKPIAAEQYIVNLSDFIRLMINNQQKSASLKEEIDMLENYITLQKIRFEDAIKVSIDINEKFLGYKLPFFTLVSLFENAIKHNVLTNEMPLNIELYDENGWIVVANNIQPKFVMATSRTGLININKRSKILTEQDIKVENDSNHFTVKVKLQMQ